MASNEPEHLGSAREDAFYTRLLIIMLAVAVDRPRHGPPPETLTDLRRRWTESHSLASIANFAESAIDFPEITGYASFSPSKAVVCSLLERGFDYEPGYSWLEHALRTQGTSVHELVQQFRRELWPIPYPGRVSNFHDDVNEYRWVAASDLPDPHDPFKLPEAPLKRFRDGERGRTDRLLASVGTANHLRARRRRRVRAWQNSLTADELAGWSFLNVDWAEALDAAGLILNTRPWSEEAMRHEVECLRADIRDAVASLFIHPITWTPGDSRLSAGQHRCIAMRVQDVEQVLVACPRRGDNAVRDRAPTILRGRGIGISR